MSKTPRTWTLQRSVTGGVIVKALKGKRNLPLDPMEVIEKAPVDAERERMLDLLERLRATAMPYVKEAAPGEQMDGEWCQRFDSLCDAIYDVEALLREHDRLTDSPSAPVSLERGE